MHDGELGRDGVESEQLVSMNSSDVSPVLSRIATNQPFSVELTKEIDLIVDWFLSLNLPCSLNCIEPISTNRAFSGSMSRTTSKRAALIVLWPGTAHNINAPPYILGETTAPFPKFHGINNNAGGEV